MSVLIIEHAQGRADGLCDEASKYGFEVHVWRPYKDEAFNIPVTEFQGLIVGGGPMGVYQLDEYTFFKEEIRLIESAFSVDLPSFGVCLGAQIFAQLLGSKVEKTFWRRGYMSVSRTLDSREDPLFDGISQSFPTFQFHKDEILALPNNSVLSLTSDNCTVEGFHLVNCSIWAIQSHPEIGEKKAMTILRSVDGLDGDEIQHMLEKSADPKILMNSRLFRNFFEFLKK